MNKNIRSNKTSDVLLELVAVLFLASSGLFVRNSALSPINTGLWRIILAFPILFFFARKDVFKVDKKDAGIALLGGVFLALDIVFFNLALVNTSMPNCNLLTNMTAFIIVPFSYFIFKEKVPKFYLLGLTITIVGVIILVLGKKNGTKSNYLGDTYAIIACVFYASYFLTTYKLRNKLASSTILCIGAISSMITLATTAFFVEGLQAPHSIGSFLNLLGFAICIQICGQNILAHCQGKISVNLSVAITLLQTPASAIYSFLVFGEKLAVQEIIGIAIVIAGVYICKRQYSD